MKKIIIVAVLSMILCGCISFVRAEGETLGAKEVQLLKEEPAKKNDVHYGFVVDIIVGKSVMNDLYVVKFVIGAGGSVLETYFTNKKDFSEFKKYIKKYDTFNYSNRSSKHEKIVFTKIRNGLHIIQITNFENFKHTFYTTEKVFKLFRKAILRLE